MMPNYFDYAKRAMEADEHVPLSVTVRHAQEMVAFAAEALDRRDYLDVGAALSRLRTELGRIQKAVTLRGN
jgi:hypothetical protein